VLLIPLINSSTGNCSLGNCIGTVFPLGIRLESKLFMGEAAGDVAGAGVAGAGAGGAGGGGL